MLATTSGGNGRNGRSASFATSQAQKCSTSQRQKPGPAVAAGLLVLAWALAFSYRTLEQDVGCSALRLFHLKQDPFLQEAFLQGLPCFLHALHPRLIDLQ